MRLQSDRDCVVKKSKHRFFTEYFTFVQPAFLNPRLLRVYLSITESFTLMRSAVLFIWYSQRIQRDRKKNYDSLGYQCSRGSNSTIEFNSFYYVRQSFVLNVLDTSEVYEAKNSITNS